MWWRLKWVILWSLWAGRVVRQPTVGVRVSNGWVRGSIAPSGSHVEYFGIPYASVVKRFQAPGPEPTWEGTFEAIEEYVRCRQAVKLEATTTMGQEDCLVLNVYTPLNIPPNKPLPVMVYVHGGGFFENSASQMIYGPRYLISKGIVLVTLNYRLNIQGFLCLGIKEAPGNAGMKDQVAALKWVQRNIRAFGGDPNNVTLFGESAGGASASFHILSPMSKGLFHKAIIQSGSSLAAWAFQYKPVYLASLLAKKMGFNVTDANELYRYFMTKTDTDLVVNRVPRQEGNTIISELLYSPCAERKIEGEEPFLTELPHDVLLRGEYNKVPVMIGTNSQEGLIFINMEKDHLIERVVFERSFPKDLTFPSNETRNAIANELRRLYLKEKVSSLKVQLNQYYGEAYSIYPVLEETELLARTSGQPVYSYIFAYDGWRNVVKSGVSDELKKVRGAAHADELFYLFSQVLIPTFFETEMIEKMTTMWTDFAKYGDPTPATTDLLPVRWPVSTLPEPKALLIDAQFSVIPMWYTETLRFWKDVYRKYRRKLS